MKNNFFIYILLFVLSISFSPAFADDLSLARQYIQKAKTATIVEQSYDYMNEARKLLEKEYENSPTNVEVLMSLSEVWQLIGDRQQAKIYIIKAYNIKPYDKYVQKAMGDFYFSFQEYNTALEYYKLALATGLLEDYETNVKTAKCYEKLGDLENAQLYYKICNYVNPSSQITKNKVNEYESMNRPDDSETLEKAKYKYLFKSKPKSETEKTTEETDDIILRLNNI
ncbi:hypothetical protein II906_09385 [bacterium]|nr:hypothetical protein [bacterium]